MGMVILKFEWPKVLVLVKSLSQFGLGDSNNKHLDTVLETESPRLRCQCDQVLVKTLSLVHRPLSFQLYPHMAKKRDASALLL